MSAARRSTFQPSQHGTDRPRWDWPLIAVCIAVFALILGGMLILGAIARSTDADLKAPAPGITACPTEDSDNCYWDADTMGNGIGQDSIVLTDGVADVTAPREGE